MKWLLVTPEFPPQGGGGIITYYEELVPALVACGCDVTVLLGSHVTEGLGSFRWSGVPVHSLQPGEARAVAEELRGLDPFPELRRALGAAWALKRRAAALVDPDVVEIVDWGLLFLPWVLEPPAGARLIVQLHGSMGQIAARDGNPEQWAQNGLIRLLEARGLRGADELQAYGSPNADFWRSTTGRPVAMIPPAFNVRGSGDGRERSGPPLVVGRVQRWKGPQVLCQALRRSPVSRPIRWIGREAPDPLTGRGFGETLARDFPDVWGTGIQPVGPMPRRAVDDELQRCGYLIVPSTWDTFNFTAVEAMAAGCPVICSTGAGAAGLIEDGKNGIHVEPGDPASLAVAIGRMEALSPAARREIGDCGRETVRARLDPHLVALERVRRAGELVGTKRPCGEDRWGLEGLVSPGPPVSRPLAFLEQFPVREVAGYTLRRGLRRLAGIR